MGVGSIERWLERDFPQVAIAAAETGRCHNHLATFQISLVPSGAQSEVFYKSIENFYISLFPFKSFRKHKVSEW